MGSWERMCLGDLSGIGCEGFAGNGGEGFGKLGLRDPAHMSLDVCF